VVSSSSPKGKEAVMILLASVSSGILAIWPNREIRRAWTIADRRAWLPGCLSHLVIPQVMAPFDS